jgi:hypothetical protein
MTLPDGAVGLVIRLPRPIIKGIAREKGTPSLTVPLNTVSTLRFAVARVKTYLRPQAEYELRVRYAADNTSIIGDPVVTNVMPYGYLPDEVSHKEVRLRVPKESLDLIDLVRQAGLPVPVLRDPAFLEWPTAVSLDFHLTFLDPQSTLGRQARELFNAARSAGQLVGTNACWLPPNVSPVW